MEKRFRQVKDARSVLADRVKTLMDQVSSLKQANAKLADENRVLQGMGGVSGLPAMGGGSGGGGGMRNGHMRFVQAGQMADMMTGRDHFMHRSPGGGGMPGHIGFAGAGMMMDAMSGQNHHGQFMSPRPPGGGGGGARGSGRRGRRRDDY